MRHRLERDYWKDISGRKTNQSVWDIKGRTCRSPPNRPSSPRHESLKASIERTGCSAKAKKTAGDESSLALRGIAGGAARDF